MQAHLRKFWFGENPDKIPENSGTNRENLGKIFKNLQKIPENMGKNGAQLCLIWKYGTQRLEVQPKKVFIRKYSDKMLSKNFSGKFGKFGQKSFAPPNICLLQTYGSMRASEVTIIHSESSLMCLAIQNTTDIWKAWPKTTLTTLRRQRYFRFMRGASHHHSLALSEFEHIKMGNGAMAHLKITCGPWPTGWESLV